MKKLLYIALILISLGAIIIYVLPEKRRLRDAIETEIPYDSCKHFFQYKSHWNHWINDTSENETSIVSKANDWGGYCTAKRIEKGFLTNIESIETIQLVATDGGCNIQWQSVLVCKYPIGRINGYIEQNQRQADMKIRLNTLDSILKASYQTPPKTIDSEISIHEE